MVIELEKKYEEDYKHLIKKLWPDIQSQEINELIQNHYLQKEKIFIYVMINGDKAVGFINTSIRNDYVEGCSSLGVAYVEGIYVCEPYRRNQIAYRLLKHTISYYRQLGIKEIGSDTEIENEMSQIFHKAIGFKEVGRNVHYIMKIDGE